MVESVVQVNSRMKGVHADHNINGAWNEPLWFNVSLNVKLLIFYEWVLLKSPLCVSKEGGTQVGEDVLQFVFHS